MDGNGGSGQSGGGNKKICPSGGTGENCGDIDIYDTVIVYAYGGAGGAGGSNTTDNGAGAGGYPGAGIGGGGAGGAGATCCAGAGGYTGGSGEGNSNHSDNGLAGWIATSYNMHWEGGGYYQGADGDTSPTTPINLKTQALGGMGGVSFSVGHSAGDGGTAGKGGNVKVNNTSNTNKATVYAFNGNMYTDSTGYRNGLNQAVIYLQNGILITRYAQIGQETSNYPAPNNTSLPILEVVEEGDNNFGKSGYINKFYDTVTDNSDKVKTINDILKNVDMSLQGVGSGAGYIEVSNGSFKLCNQSITGVLEPIN